MFLNPGSLPSTVHEEQWKRLMNIDTEQGRELVKLHSKLNKYHPPPQGTKSQFDEVLSSILNREHHQAIRDSDMEGNRYILQGNTLVLLFFECSHSSADGQILCNIHVGMEMDLCTQDTDSHIH